MKYNKMAFIRTNDGSHPPLLWSFLLSKILFSAWLLTHAVHFCHTSSWTYHFLGLTRSHFSTMVWVQKNHSTSPRVQTSCRSTAPFPLRANSSEIVWGMPRGHHSKARTTFLLCITQKGRHLLCSVCVISIAPSSGGKNTTVSSYSALSLGLQLLFHNTWLSSFPAYQLFVKWELSFPVPTQ